MHAFMLAWLCPDSHKKGTNKAACLGLEAIMAILLSNKLPGMSHEEGCSFNDAHCGCRFWGKGCVRDTLIYVSFEKVDDDFLPIMVHPDLRHVKKTYGNNGTSLISKSMIVNNPFHPHLRVEKVFLKAFKLSEDEEKIKLLFQQAEKRGGKTFLTSFKRRWI